MTATITEFRDYTDPTRFQIVEARRDDGRMVVRGRFQMIDTKNANGRIYSAGLWERVLSDDKLNEALRNRRMLGEVEHPCLTTDDFRVLTQDGWKPFSDVRIGDKVWSRVDGEAVLSDVHGIVDEPYSGIAMRVRSRSIDSEFTPGHRFLMLRRPDQGDRSEFYATISDIALGRGSFRHSPIPKTAEWHQEAPATVTIPTYMGGKRAAFRERVEKDLVLDARLYAGLLGLYLAEGHCPPANRQRYMVHISQKTPWAKRLIWDELLSKFEDLEWREVDDGFAVTDARLHHYLKKLGKVRDKWMPAEAKRLAPEHLQELIFWYAIGDGRVFPSKNDRQCSVDSVPDHLKEWYTARSADIGSGSFKEAAATAVRTGLIPYTRMDLHSVSETLIRDLHECVVRSGGSATLSRIEPTTDYQFAGRTIRAENKVPLWQLRISTTENIYLDPRFTAIEPRHHEGRIYCLQVTHGNFYMEQNGRSFWTGNSDGTTNLNRVCHIVTRLERKGNEIIGEAEILNTPAGRIIQELFRAGVQVGISSRGRGSSYMRNGAEYVDESSFQLDTFDFVYKPSTPGAYPQLVESVLKNSPYAKESTMAERETELKRLEVRAMDIAEHAHGDLGIEELQAAYAECIELEASTRSLAESLDEAEVEEHGEWIDTILTKIAEARAIVTALMDNFHETRDADLDRKAENVKAGIALPSVTETSNDSPSVTVQTKGAVSQETVELIEQLRDSRDHYKARLDEALGLLDADTEEITRRYGAATRLGEELLSRLHERERELSEVSEAYDALLERYQAAVELVAEATEQSDRSRLVQRVREATEAIPDLRKFSKSLLSCETEEELEERIAEIVDALDLPPQDKHEAMTGYVYLGGAREEDDPEQDDEAPLGERSALPRKGDAINESKDADVLAGTGSTLTESIESSGAAVASRVVATRPGWK